MKKAKLKKILHAMIDILDDKYILYDLKENIFPYIIKYRTKKSDKADNDLTEEQIIQLDKTTSQQDAETITMNEVKKSFAEWVPDEKKKAKQQKKILNTSKNKLRKKLHKLIDSINSKYLLNVLLDDIMPDALDTSKYD